MGAEARLSCVHVQLGLEGKKKNKRWCTYPSSPASWAPLASATLCVSGQSSLTVGSAGLCGGLFILERGLPSGSLHLSKHPPRPLLCVPGLTQPPHPTPPHLQPAALPHTLFPALSLLHPTVQFFLLLSFSSSCPVFLFLLLPGLLFFFSHGFFRRIHPQFHPHVDERKSSAAWIREGVFYARLQEIIQYKAIIQLVSVGLDEK